MTYRLPAFFFLLATALAAQSPPATQPASPYEQAVAGLRALHEENLTLRARLAALEQDQQNLPEMRIFAGGVMHVRVDEFEPLDGEPHLRDFRWDFGDEQGDYNLLGGFNAAHLYERPGSYIVSLNGRPVRRVVVAEDARLVRAVLSEPDLGAALRAGNTILQLPAGDLAIRATLSIAPGTQIVGHPEGSKLTWHGPRGGIMFDAPAGNLTLRNITFDSATADAFEKTAATVLQPGGTDIALIGCTFLNVNDAVNGNRAPQRVLMQDCRAPSHTGIRSYLAWVEGRQWVFLGNVAVNSTREHIIRIGSSGPSAPGNSFVLVAYNDFNNLDRRSAADQPDKTDIAKSCLIFQAGGYGWAEHNLFRGISGVGPLGGPDGLRDAKRRFSRAVFRDNRHLDTLHLDHGAQHILIADSRFELPPSGGSGFSSIQVAGYDAQYDRRVDDLTLRDSVLVSPFKNACQLWIKGPIGQRFQMSGNAFVGGSESYRWGTMPFIIAGGWQDVYRSSGNELPPAPGGWPDKNAFARFGEQNDEAGYVTFARWSALPGVSGDSVGAVGMKVE